MWSDHECVYTFVCVIVCVHMHVKSSLCGMVVLMVCFAADGFCWSACKVEAAPEPSIWLSLRGLGSVLTFILSDVFVNMF